MKALAILLALSASPAYACGLLPDTAGVILYTDHLNATREFDEGLRPRGITAGWDCGNVNLAFAAYDHSFAGFAMGYTLSATYDPLTLHLGPISATPIVGLSWYPDKPFAALEETGGFFPLVGATFTADLSDDVGLFLNWYPTFGQASTFSDLLVAGVTFNFD